MRSNKGNGVGQSRKWRPFLSETAQKLNRIHVWLQADLSYWFISTFNLHYTLKQSTVDTRETSHDFVIRIMSILFQKLHIFCINFVIVQYLASIVFTRFNYIQTSRIGLTFKLNYCSCLRLITI